jgi:cytidyltransferase-like protein
MKGKIPMIDFKTYFKMKHNMKYTLLEEAINLNDFITEKQNKKVGIFNGRFQPFTLGHKSFIKAIKDDGLEPLIIIIKGAKSSKELDKNPFDADDQIDQILKSTKDLGITKDNILIADSSYILTLVQAAREKGFEPVAIYAGPDRLKAYESMLGSTSETEDGEEVVLKDAFNLDIEYKSGKSDGENRVTASDGTPISASLVRKTLTDDDFEKFMMYTGNVYDKKDFEYMRDKVTSGLKDAKEKEIQKQIDKVKKAKDRKLAQLKKAIEKAKTEVTKEKKQKEYENFESEFDSELEKLNSELDK